MRQGWLRRAIFVLVPLLAAILVGCSGGGTASSGPRSGPLQVVAAENFWGSLAAQIGGDKVQVTNIIDSPDADPHDYEPTPEDARAVATADYVIYNGLGYDGWAGKLLASSKSSKRTDVTIQQVLGLKDDDNPHRWYSPSNVQKVIDRITADYKKLDPSNASAYDQQRAALLSTGLKQYLALVAEIKQKYSGTPVGATESIASPLASDLGLKMLTPAAFLSAISEGNDPTAKDKATFDDQIAKKQIQVLLFNTQNATPDVQRLVDAAKALGIPVVEITETLDPATASFQEWQTQELQDLKAALSKATGKP